MAFDLNQVCNRIDELKPEMMAMWKRFVDRDCGSRNKAGVDAGGADAKAFLESIGFKVRFYEYEKAGNLLIAEKGDMTKPFVCLVGHLDTVFPDGHAAARPFTVKDGVVTGPGCLDMKGGVTLCLHALKALYEAGWDRYPVKIMLAGDEEVGHGQSTASDMMIKEAKGALFGLNFETSFIDNSVVVERKGVAQYRFDVSGIGAHAGNNPKDGRSAIRELARKIEDIYAVTDWDEGTTINVGLIGGGTAANACPEAAWCLVDIRFKTQAGLERAARELKAVEEKQYIDGTKTVMKKTFEFSAMERLPGSLELFDKINKIAVSHGFPEMRAKAVGGGSDSACLTRAGIPVVCALGVKGEFNHTVREYALESSLTERAKLLATILAEI